MIYPNLVDPFHAASLGLSLIDFLLIQAANTRNPVWLWRCDYTIVQRLATSGFTSIAEVEALSDSELLARLPGFGGRELAAIRRATRPDADGRPPTDIRGNPAR